MSADDFPQYSSSAAGDDPYVTRPLAMPEVLRRPGDPYSGERATRTSNRPPRSRRGMILNIIAVLLLMVVVGTGAGLYYLDQSYQGKIYPNVSIQGIPVGEFSRDQAEAALRQRYSAFLAQPATLTYDGRTWTPTPEDLGIRFDFTGAADAAYRAGRGNGVMANLLEVKAIWDNGLELPLKVSFDQTKLRAYLQSITAGVDQAPVDATLALEGTTVRTTPARAGRQVLIDQTLQELSNGLLSLTPQSVAIQTRELPPRLADAEVAAAQQQIAALLQGPYTLTVEKKEYSWAVEDIALMIDTARVPKDSASDRIAVELNRFPIARRIRQIADETGRGSVNPRLDWNGGNLRILKPGKPGLRVDEAAALQAVLAGMSQPNRTLALPVAEVAPQVTEANLNTLGIKELVSVGRSDFTGSAAYRVTNIGVGMQILNGILLAPGEEFSFNQNIGSIDARNGFVEGYAIISNRTQLEFGGGICQDSTTMFRAAFWAGLPITERWGHSFYISWYDKYALGPLGNGPGMDATIFTGGPDLKFVNDTGSWLLIQSSSNPRTGLAEIAFYGTKPDRSVAISQRVYNQRPAITEPVYIPDPKQPRGRMHQTDTARGGMTIDVYRTITENGVAKEPELFRTVFKPWANKYAVNPADLGPDGKPNFNRQPEQPTADPAQPAPPAAEQPAPAPPVVEQPVPEQPAPEVPAPEQPAPEPEPQG
ncbi:MAG: VanW family protein [Roseiflexaceae bacterium]